MRRPSRNWSYVPRRPPPWRQETINRLQREAVKIMRQVSLGSASDRLREKGRQHAQLAQDIHKRLDAVDEMEARAVPVIQRELEEREYNVRAIENDAEAIRKLAEDLGNGGPTDSPKPVIGSDAAAEH